MKQLLTARVVYRTINQKIGFVQLKDNQSYSIRGYFIPATNTGYQFITYNPIKQFWEISKVIKLFFYEFLYQLTFVSYFHRLPL